MAIRSRAMVPSTASRVLIHIKQHKDGQLAGVLYSPYLEKSFSFADVVDFTNQLDGVFDSISFPQAAMRYRRFRREDERKTGGEAQPPNNGQEKAEEMAMTEKLTGQEGDTFVVHVQFRQNATWQGTVAWAGQNQALHFRSTLELLKIMDSALAANHPEEAET